MTEPARVRIDGLVHDVRDSSRTGLSGLTPCGRAFRLRGMHGLAPKMRGKFTEDATTCLLCLVRPPKREVAYWPAGDWMKP